MAKKAAGLLLGLGADRCSKFHNSSSRTRNLKVEDFLERWFCYLQVLFRSRSGLKASKLLKLMISKTGQIWVKKRPRRRRVVSNEFLASESNQTNSTRIL